MAVAGTRRARQSEETVQSVEIRDVVIPEALEDAMSRQAQAERERQARVILGESEKQIAESFRQASLAYQEKGALVIVPSSAVDTMNLGGLAGVTALAANAGAMVGSAGVNREGDAGQ